MNATEDKRAGNQARAQFDSIKEMVENLNIAIENENWEQEEEARQVINEGPLSIQVRSGWCHIGEEMKPEEFEILLCTGGPACRIIGELSLDYQEPESAKIQYQDWFTPWNDFALTSEEDEILLEYCRNFYFSC